MADKADKLKEAPETGQVEGGWSLMSYSFKLESQHIADYMKGFKEKKILGRKCPKCSRIYVPPDPICYICFIEINDLVEVPARGKVDSFTYNVSTIHGEAVENPAIMALVELEGTCSKIAARIENIKPEAMRRGMTVKAVWKAEASGVWSDLEYFVPE